jgi:hypothetical protein
VSILVLSSYFSLFFSVFIVILAEEADLGHIIRQVGRQSFEFVNLLEGIREVMQSELSEPGTEGIPGFEMENAADITGGESDVGFSSL